MGALILKSGNALNASVESFEFAQYKNRVLNDGGYVADDNDLKDALNFINGLGLSTSNLLSVVSPAWGVKKNSDGKPIKLYSLGDASGDILISANDSTEMPTIVNERGYPEISIQTNNSGVKLQSSKNNGFPLVNSIGVAKADREIIRGSSAAYGAGSYFTRLQVVELPEFNSGSVAPTSMAQMYWSRAGNSTALADNFKEMVGSVFGGAKSSATSQDKGVLSTSSYAAFIDKNVMKLYGNGSLKASSETSEPSEIDTTKRYMTSLNGAMSASYLATGLITGYFAESWIVGDVQESVVIELSKRLGSKFL